MALTATGIEDNTCYYLNNPLVVKIKETDVNWFACSVTFENIDTDESFEINRYFDQNRNLDIDLNEIIKPLFNEPYINPKTSLPFISPNVMNFKVRFRPNRIVGGTAYFLEYNVSIIRGGVYTNETNVVVRAGALGYSFQPLVYLSIEKSFIYWSSTLYNIEGKFSITTNRQSSSPSSLGTRMPVRNCDGIYLAFLDSKGGVSGWYFDTHTENIKTNSEGYYNDHSKVVDYGSEYSKQLTLTSKARIEMLELIKDLFVSPYIVIYNVDDNTTERVVADSHTLNVDKSKGTFFFDLKIDYITNVNTKVSW